MRHQSFFVYILTNQRHTVHIGVTNHLQRRLSQHSGSSRHHFARQYNADKLIHFEVFSNPLTAIAREKQLKSWRRSKKEALIAVANPEWHDLNLEMLAVQ